MSEQEFTVDELANRANMTVRNVRAYASRGLIPPPRLEGRTGYYSLEHLQRLQLVRQLLDRGFTLAAVEDALLRSPETAPGHALELLSILEPVDEEEAAEVMARADLAALAGVPSDDELIEKVVALGLAEWVDPQTVRVLQPSVVRPGASAIAMGLSPDTVLAMVPLIGGHVRDVADHFVEKVTEEIIDPFVEAGLPEDQWPTTFQTIDNLVRVANQVVLAMFRAELHDAVEIKVGEKLQEMADNAARQ